MDWSTLFLGKLSLETNLNFCLRLLLACICGAAIGIERSRHFKDAGVRTHVIVCMGAALVMIVSKYGFVDLTGIDGSEFPGTRGADPARVAAQVVSGISFLGAGIIYRDRNFTTKGLTTAAGIWAVAAIGLAVGAGLYLVGVFTTVYIVILQYFLHKIAVGNERNSDVHLDLVLNNGSTYQQRLMDKLKEWDALVMETQMRREDETHTRYILSLKLNMDITDDMLYQVLSENGEISSIKLTRDI